MDHYHVITTTVELEYPEHACYSITAHHHHHRYIVLLFVSLLFFLNKEHSSAN